MECIHFNSSENTCVWRRSEPSLAVYCMYAIVIPILALFGCIANSLNALVFIRPNMKPSVFTYLAILSWVDSLCCLMIFLTAVSRSLCLNSIIWIEFDLKLQPLIFGSLTGGANWILAAVTLDRIIYLQHRMPKTPPKFCTRRIARINACGIMVMSAALNVPYFFTFAIQDDGTFNTTNLYRSRVYKFHNWLTFAVLCIIPGLLLLFGNIAVIILFRQWVKKRKNLFCRQEKDFIATRNRQQHQVKLTITIITVVFLYMIGELPAHITSRKNAVNLLFGGDATKINFDKIEQFEVFFLTLNALQLSFNIIVYAVVNPIFMTEFFSFLREISDVCVAIVGITAIRKCWHKVKTKYSSSDNAMKTTGVVCENQAYVSQFDEIFTIERDVSTALTWNLDSAVSFKTYEIQKQDSQSCLDLRVISPVPDKLFKNEIFYQRHSFSF